MSVESKQLCWRCRYAVPLRSNDKRCPWEETGSPVPGWDAKETTMLGYRSTIVTYVIKKCPLYKEG